MPAPPNLALALCLAARGWYILPLTPTTKRPLGNCRACTAETGLPAHRPEDCPCLPVGRWCHGVRAATTDPTVIASWWRDEPRAVPGVAAGPSCLTLLDIDAHAAPIPADLATGLLPGIDLTAELIDSAAWNHGRYRDGRDGLQLLARIRGGPHPWPQDPARQPISTVTPSGGAHLWYQAPAEGLRQVLTDPDARGRYGLAWQVDIKAGWSYGVAPGAITENGRYLVRRDSPERPGRMPHWLAQETIRVAARPTAPRPSATTSPKTGDGPGPAAYVRTVINRGTTKVTAMKDGRKRALSALSYQVGGLLEWSGLSREEVMSVLISVGTAAGLSENMSTRIVSRAIDNGVTRPLTPPGFQS